MTYPEGHAAERQLANAIRALAMDAVQAANSGHPGMPMGLADVATVLYSDYLKFDPAAPKWADRDRFVLSAGHASMLLYSLLHLAEVQAIDDKYETVGKPSVSLDEIKRFRQLHSHTPGHPEYGDTVGVETTTGPLGQGFGNAVGMAIAAQMEAARFHNPQLLSRVFVTVGDGDLMEGISYEAACLAGHLQLGNLVCLFDDNGITIEGHTDLATSEDIGKRFEARFSLVLMSVLGAAALLLTAVGVFGVISYSVSQRTRMLAIEGAKIRISASTMKATVRSSRRPDSPFRVLGIGTLPSIGAASSSFIANSRPCRGAWRHFSTEFFSSFEGPATPGRAGCCVCGGAAGGSPSRNHNHSGYEGPVQ